MRGYLQMTVGTPPTDTAAGFLAFQATTPDDNGVLLLTINAQLAGLIRPRGTTSQRLMVRVTAHLPAGIKTLWSPGIISWTVEESSDGGTQWTLTTPGSRETPGGGFDHGFFGWELDYNGAPPPGNGLVRLELLYDLPDGTTAPFTLFSGYSMESNRPDDPTAGHRLELTGMGGEAFFDRAIGSYQLPPRHGLTHGQIAAGLLLAGGVPAAQIKVGADVGSPRDHPFDLACSEVWPPAKEVIRSAGSILYWDRSDPPLAKTRPIHGGLFS